MLTDAERAALERLHRSAGRPGDVAAAVAIALREHPADEGEKWTREWLVTIGFSNDGQATEGVDYLWINGGSQSVCDLQIRSADDELYSAEVWCLARDGENIPIPAPETRGDVYRLLGALRIGVKG